MIVYLVIDHLAFWADHGYTKIKVDYYERAKKNGNYIVFETARKLYSAGGLVALIAIFSFLMTMVYAVGPRNDEEIIFLGFVVVILIIIGSLSIVYGLYILAGRNLILMVSDQGFEFARYGMRKRSEPRMMNWFDINRIRIGETEMGGRRFGIYIYGNGARIKLYGDWINADFLCRDALEHVPIEAFNSPALNHFKRYSANTDEKPLVDVSLKVDEGISSKN